MSEILFESIDEEKREVTFKVNGNLVTRRVPAKFEGDISDYICALVKGLEIEIEVEEPQSINNVTFIKGEDMYEHIGRRL